MRLFSFVLLMVLAGCSGPREVEQDAPVTVRTVGALRDSLAAPAGGVRRAVAARRLGAAGVTPLADGAFTIGSELPGVGGFVPGRHPIGRPELVVLGSALDAATAPVVLEAARMLVTQSLAQNVPERTVLVAFWGADESAAQGVATLLRQPLWPRSAVRAVVVVGDALGDDAAVGVSVRSVSAEGAAPEAVARVVAAVLDAATFRPPVPADSTR